MAIAFNKDNTTELIAVFEDRLKRGASLHAVLAAGAIGDKVFVAQLFANRIHRSFLRVSLAELTKIPDPNMVVFVDGADSLLANAQPGDLKGLPAVTFLSVTKLFPQAENRVDVTVDFGASRPASPAPAPSATPTPVQALSNLNFRVVIGDSEAGFCEVSRLTSEGTGTGTEHNPNIVLKRAVTQSKDLYLWRQNIVDGKTDLRNVVIHQLDNAGQTVNSWMVRDCWPCRWSGPEFNSLQGSIALEELELCYNRFAWL